MGVEILRYLVPTDRAWRPDFRTMSLLVESLTADRWVPEDPWEEALYTPKGHHPLGRSIEETLGQCDESEFVLRWDVRSCGERKVRFPLMSAPVDEAKAYYGIRVCRTTDYVYRISETIQPFPGHLLTCACGERLEYWGKFPNPIGAGRIRACCPRCGRAVDVSQWPAQVIDGWSGQGRIIPGGATSRFAVVADVGKCWSRSAEQRLVHPELIACCTAVLRVPLVEIEDLA